MTGLCLSGGGARGAFQAGVLEYFAENPSLFPEGFQAGAGTSVGAINIAGLAMEAGSTPGEKQLEHYAKFTNECWEKLSSTKDVWRLKVPPYAAGLWSPSIGDNSPLRKLLLEIVDFDAVMNGIPCSVVAWNLLSGKSKVWSLVEASNKEQLISFLMASSSFPIAFPPEKIGKELFTDGGIVDIAPTKKLIRQGCTKIVSVLCRNVEIPDEKKQEELRSAISVGMRCLDGMESEIVRGDLEQIELWNLLIEAGHPAAKEKKKIEMITLSPCENLGDPLDFSMELTKKRMQIGKESARRWAMF